MRTPYELGRADSYYGRGCANGLRELRKGRWTSEQFDEYRAGYDENEKAGEFKEWRPGYSIEGDDYDEDYD